MSNYYFPRAKIIYHVMVVIWYVLALIEIALIFRFLLKLFDANPRALFTGWVYNLTEPLLWPFANVFASTATNGMLIEWPTLLALAVYWFIGWAIVELLLLGRGVSSSEAVDKLRHQEEH